MNMDFSALQFDPGEATVVRTPPGVGYGYWVGGHKVSFDEASGTFALFYRERTPLEAGRGGVCRVALSGDGVTFDDVWTATKDELNSTSIEVGHCLRHDEREWRLYVSYELKGSGIWRVDVLRGPTPESLDTQGRRTVLSPRQFGLPWLKDPVVYRRHDGGYRMYVAGPARTGPTLDGDRIIASSVEATLLADSDDGHYFPEIEYVLEPPNTDAWNGRRARINSVFPWDGEYLATYDGGRTDYDNYEEWASLATSPDGVSFTAIEADGPWLRSPYGAVRYVFAQPAGEKLFVYFEYTREDLSHDLRVAVLDLP